MKRKALPMLAAALAVGLIAAGCGGDDDGDSSDDLTHEEFVTEANQICKQGNAEIEGSAPNVQPGTPEFDAFVTDSLVPNIQGQIDDIRDLGIPEEDESLNATLDEAERITEEIAADPISITKGDPFSSINQDLREVGLTECSDG